VGGIDGIGYVAKSGAQNQQSTISNALNSHRSQRTILEPREPRP